MSLTKGQEAYMLSGNIVVFILAAIIFGLTTFALGFMTASKLLSEQRKKPHNQRGDTNEEA